MAALTGGRDALAEVVADPEGKPLAPRRRTVALAGPIGVMGIAEIERTADVASPASAAPS